MELDAALVPGTPLVDALPKGETVFDLEITWNRSDCLSVIGIAREFAARFGEGVQRLLAVAHVLSRNGALGHLLENARVVVALDE